LSLPPHPQNPCRKTYKQGGTQPKSWFFSVVASRQQPCKQKQHTHLPLSLSLYSTGGSSSAARTAASGMGRERGEKTQKRFVPVGEKKGNNRL